MHLVEPMLATGESDNLHLLVPYCENDDFGAQQKVDGDRLLIHVDGGLVRATSRNHSIVTGVSRSILNAFSRLPGRWVFDGEYFEKTYYLFDVIEMNGVSMVNEPLYARYAALETFLATFTMPDNVVLLRLETEHEAKCELASFVIENNCEGLVFKLLDSVYEPGERSTTWQKLKFRHECDAVVTGLRKDGKSNIVVAVYRDGVLTDIGEVTALAGDGRRVKKDDVVRVTYQYMTKAGKLFQPTKPMLRRDKLATECLWEQLVFESVAVRP